MVRDFHRIIGVEARGQVLDLVGRLPDAVVACVGGGSNAMGIFHRFIDDAVGAPDRPRGRRRGRRHRPPRGPVRAGIPGVLHGAFTYVLQDEDGQTVESHSISAGLDYPSVGPEHAYLQRLRPRGVPPDHRRPRRWRRSRCSAAPRASSRPSRARTRSPARMQVGRELGPDGVAAGQPLRSRRQGRRTPPPRGSGCCRRGRRGRRRSRTGRDGMAVAWSAWAVRSRRVERRAGDEVPRQTARPRRLPARSASPTSQGSIEAMVAMVEAGVDIVEIGVPYSDPLMDGPVIQHAAEAALAARGPALDRRLHRRPRRCADAGAPAARDDLLEPRPALRRRAVRRRPRRGRGCRADHPRPHPRRGRRRGSPPPSATTSTGSSSWRRARPTQRLARHRRGLPRASSTPPRTMGVTGARTSVGDAAGTLVSAPGRSPTCRSASGSASPPAPRPPRSAAFADGVIVGSALVRCLRRRRRPRRGPRRAARADHRAGRRRAAEALSRWRRDRRPPTDGPRPGAGCWRRARAGRRRWLARRRPEGRPPGVVRPRPCRPTSCCRTTWPAPSATPCRWSRSRSACCWCSACSPGRRPSSAACSWSPSSSASSRPGPAGYHRLRLLRRRGNYRRRADALPLGDRCGTSGSPLCAGWLVVRPRTALSLDRRLF